MHPIFFIKIAQKIMLNRLKPTLKKNVIFAVALFLGLSAFRIFAPEKAVSTTVMEYQIRKLQTDVYQLQREVNLLQSRRGRNNSNECLECREPREGRNRMLSGDPMFDRLATMTVEIKQDVREMQTRLRKLEEKINN